MNRKNLRALIVLNIVLLAALVVVGLSPQPAQGQMVRAEYVMVSGEVQGRSQQAMVYIVDLASNRIAAVIFNSSNNQLELIDGADLTRDEDDDRRTR